MEKTKETPPTRITTMTSISRHCSNQFASIDMGTNSFKLFIINFEPTTKKFTTIHQISNPIILTHQSTSISINSQLQAIQSLKKFQSFLHSNRVFRTRIVATSATREAENRVEFIQRVERHLGFDFRVDLISGLEEARLIYMGVLQFCKKIENKKVLTVDIGGGSTEFVIGENGVVIYRQSLKLGHVKLTQKFLGRNLGEIRDFVREEIELSGVVEKVKGLGFEVVIGSSGTIKAIEKAMWVGYGCNEGKRKEKERFWWFEREELKGFVERLSGEGLSDRVRRDGFFGRRSEFIVAGAILLDEIFEVLGIREMEVSGYALGEGVVVDMICEGYDGFDLNGDMRWKSVVRLAMRFNGKDRMRKGAKCVALAKEMFEGLRKYNKIGENQDTIGFCLDEKDLEYLEAACMLHNIGAYHGKKGYHKSSYSIIMGCGELDGYTLEEIEFIALLVKHHRKKFPASDHTPLPGSLPETTQKFGILCFILRVSVIVQQYSSSILTGIEFDHHHEGLILALVVDQSMFSDSEESEDLEMKIREEISHFEEVFHHKLMVVTRTHSQQ